MDEEARKKLLLRQTLAWAFERLRTPHEFSLPFGSMPMPQQRYSMPNGLDETMRRTDYPMQALSRSGASTQTLIEELARLQMMRKNVRGEQRRSGGLYQ